jgi:predicted DNA-binding transcriptional regulator YafY
MVKKDCIYFYENAWYQVGTCLNDNTPLNFNCDNCKGKNINIYIQEVKND